MSGVEIVDLIAAAIADVKICSEVYKLIKDMQDLPVAFREASKQLPLAQSTLEAVQRAAQDVTNAGKDDPSNLANDGESMLMTISSCKNKADELKEIFRKTHDLREDWHLFREDGTDQRVEALTRSILDNLLSLCANQGFRLATQDQVDNIKRANIKQALEAVDTQAIQDNLSDELNRLFGSNDMFDFKKACMTIGYQASSSADISLQSIESGTKREQYEAKPAQSTSWMKIIDPRYGAQRFVEVKVDEGSNVNFLTREMARDRGLELQSLGSEPLQCNTPNGLVVCEKCVKLTLLGEDGEDQQHVETTFYVLPSNLPSSDLRITTPLIGRHFLQEFGHLLLDEDPHNPVSSTEKGEKNTYMREQIQQEASKSEAYHANCLSEEADRTSVPSGSFSESEPTRKRVQTSRVEGQGSHLFFTTVPPSASHVSNGDVITGDGRWFWDPEPAEMFDAEHPISTNPTALSHAGMSDDMLHSSGYYDTATEYTSSWREHPHSKELIREMAQHLLEEAKLCSRDEIVLDRIANALPDLLRAFALRLGYDPQNTDVHDIAFFLLRNRQLIRDAFGSNMVATEHVRNDPGLDKIKARRIEKWQAQEKSSDPADIELFSYRDDDGLFEGPVQSDGHDDGDDIKLAEIAKYRKIITESAQYPWLLADMRRLGEMAPGLPDLMEKVRHTVRAVVSRDIPTSEHNPMPGCKVTFKIPWDPCGFWEKAEFDEAMTRAFQHATTITGSAEDAQATTVGEYLAQTWPVTAKHSIKLVKELFNGLGTSRTASASGLLPDGTRMHAQMESGRFQITATGAEGTVAEVGQQFIWLAAALRSSPQDDGVTACLPIIVKESRLPIIVEASRLVRSSPEISVRFTFKKIGSDKQGMDRASGFCWQDMFRNPVIVGGFPILKKPGHGLGLEMPLRLMAALAGSQRLSEFSGRTYIKGYSAMVVATAVLTNTVVWHYCYNKQGGRIAYGDHDLQSYPQVSMQQLTISRHIVGWCSTCKVYAGAADALYESIGPSDADSPSSGMILDRINLSFSHFGVGGGASLALCTRVKPKHYRPKDYVGMIEWVKTTYVVMWDEETKIGWLVNGTNAILHLARAKLHAWHNNRIYAKLLLIEPEELRDDGDRDPESAACTLLDQKNRRLKIWIASDEIKKTHGADKLDDDEISSTYLLFADVVEELVDKFEILFDEQADKAGRNGINLRRPVRQHLEGWDFLDVLRGSEISPRQVTLGFGGWGWVNFARSINVVTLIGRRFGQLIRPAQSDEVCTEWQSVKRKKYYLAASIFDLKEIRRDKPSKISHLLWHSPQDPFAKCPRCGKLDQQGEPVVTRASNDTEEHHVPVQAFWPTQIPSCVKKLKEPKYLKQVHSDGGAIIFENVVTPWFSWAAGADLNEGNPSTPVLQPKNSANEDVDTEKSRTDAQNLPRRVKQKFSHFLHSSSTQQSGEESTTDTRAGSASVSEDAAQGQLQGSVDTSDTSWASEPAQDCQHSEGVAQKRRKLDNHIVK